jgi:hypothetical protein
MNKYLLIILVTSTLKFNLCAQIQQINVKIVPFCSRSNNEFSPVFFQGGLVFCSNQNDNNMVTYKDGQNALFKIYYVTKKDGNKWERPKILADELSTDYNDGPATFNENGNIIYFSRNNFIGTFLKNVSDSSNKLGIYSAELINNKWTHIKPFTYNNPLYSFGTPALTSDGKRIYFSSDMPGGYGGMDLYYCDKGSEDWVKPVNLGPTINTSKNESFPFASKCGKLYFASDGHQGLGGKDLFYTQEIKGKWLSPVHLESPINSTSDDFGLVLDSTFVKGYFSSNRRKTDDIYSFSFVPAQFTNCDTLMENNYCFTFDDEQYQFSDTAQVIYQWDFNDGLKHVGKEVKYCFPGPGEYTVKLNITDARTGKTLTNQVSYEVKLEDIEQVYINSCNVGIVGKSMPFDGLKTNLKGYKITNYLWNFGEGYKPGEPSINWTFAKKGEYNIQLGLQIENDSLRVTSNKCVTKKIKIYDTFQELISNDEKNEIIALERLDSVKEQMKTIVFKIYFMDDLPEQQKIKIRKSLMDIDTWRIVFNSYGIMPVSYPFLDSITKILKNNLDISLNLVVHQMGSRTTGEKTELSERWAQELTFYFKNQKIDRNTLNCKSSDFSLTDLKPSKTNNKKADGIIELIFMKK